MKGRTRGRMKGRTRGRMKGRTRGRPRTARRPWPNSTLAVLRASQALSSETSLSGLAAAVGDQLTTLTGASDVLIALCHEDTGEWFLPALTGPEPAIPIAEAGRLGLVPFTAVRYVERTQEPVLVADAVQDDRFQRDPYFAGLEHCSLLVVPLRSQGATRAILTLANRDHAASSPANASTPSSSSPGS
jgi:GAF domain-containing protein